MEVLRSKIDKRPATRQLTSIAGLVTALLLNFTSGAQAQESANQRPVAAVIDEYCFERIFASNLATSC